MIVGLVSWVDETTGSDEVYGLGVCVWVWVLFVVRLADGWLLGAGISLLRVKNDRCFFLKIQPLFQIFQGFLSVTGYVVRGLASLM